MTLVGRGQHLTYSQLEEAWVKGGGSRATAPMAAAIAEAESSGWTNNVNEKDSNGAGSYGLWQINNGTTYSSQGPNYGGPPGWNNPIENARLAVAKYKGAGYGWTPWGTYTSGAYRTFLRGGIPPSAGVPGGGNISTTSLNNPGGNTNTGGGGGGFWSDVKRAAGQAFMQIIPGSPGLKPPTGGGLTQKGVSPFGFLASGLGTALGTGIETGVTNVLKDIWVPIFRRSFWLLEMVLGIFIVILTAVALGWIGLSKIEGGNQQAIRSVMAAPETGGLSLLQGAASAQANKRRQQRETRQGVSSEQAQARIDVAQRRVAIQESQEQRRKANAEAAAATPGKPAATPDLDASIKRARQRAKEIRERRRKDQ